MAAGKNGVDRPGNRGADPKRAVASAPGTAKKQPRIYHRLSKGLRSIRELGPYITDAILDGLDARMPDRYVGSVLSHAGKEIQIWKEVNRLRSGKYQHSQDPMNLVR